MPRIGTVDGSISVVQHRNAGSDWRQILEALLRTWTLFSRRRCQLKRPGSNQPARMSPDLYQYRRPIDLSNARLRTLAATLGPAYVRVSGTWANTTCFQDSDKPAPKTAPRDAKYDSSPVSACGRPRNIAWRQLALFAVGITRNEMIDPKVMRFRSLLYPCLATAGARVSGSSFRCCNSDVMLADVIWRLNSRREF